MATFIPNGMYSKRVMYLYLGVEDGQDVYSYAFCPINGQTCHIECALLTEHDGVYYCGLHSTDSIRPLTNETDDYGAE